MSAADRVAARPYGAILAATDDLPDDLALGVEAALDALPPEEVIAWLVERGALYRGPLSDRRRPLYPADPPDGG